jgi:NADH-quinone oxidoreductase subunit E
MLRGAKDITNTCRNKLGIELGETTEDNKFTLVEVECLGACVDAPLVQINNDYHENLTPESMEKLIDKLSKNK